MSEPSEILSEVCAGNQDALDFCGDFYELLHMVDDLFDRDNQVTAEDVGHILVSAIESFVRNPFFIEHKEALLPAIRSAVVAWVDSEAWHTREDPRDKIAAHVMKSQYHEVIFMVAGIVGGLSHQMEMTRKHREYDWT
jgi:hypothetical protein